MGLIKANTSMIHNNRWMKTISIIFLALHLSIGAAIAQPWVKKTAKSVFTLKTFDASGTLLGSAGGVFTDSQGHAISI